MLTDSAKPLAQLLPIEVLVWINRWAKLPDRFWYDDLDELYRLKDCKIAELTRAGLMQPTCIVQRESLAIAGMRQQLANGGAQLSHLDWHGYSWYDTLSSIEPNHYPILVEIGNGCFDAPLAEEVASQLLANWEEEKRQYQELLQAYNAALPAYQQQMQVYRELRADHERDLLLYEYNVRQKFRAYLEGIECKGQDKEVLKWLQQGVTENQLSKVKKAFNRHKQTFQPKGKKPKQPQKPREPKKPFPPSEPSLKTSIPIGQYQPGLVPEVDAAIAWVREALNRPDLQPSDIDDDFVCCDLDYYLGNVLLEQLRKQALEIFQQVIEGSLSDPQAIYTALTELELDYSESLGMASYTDFRDHTTVHRDYSKWHEINLAPTGYWLIEFESLEVPEITLHVPYDRRNQLGLDIDWRSLPAKATEQGTFGRAISPLEQRAYPLSDLLELLGVSADDFPCGLEQYRRERSMHYDWHDEDDDEDEDEFEF